MVDNSDPSMGVEELYDAYLDACYRGDGEDPETFFALHPEIDTRGRTHIRALFDVVSEAPAEAVPFERLGSYRILRRLGGGGMGTVYLAEQVALRRFVALKVIRPELQASRTALKRFEREAMAIAKLRHRNVVTIHELGADGDVRFIAMELVPGRPLNEVLVSERPHMTRVLAWILQIARALHAAHEAGIVHRDVKPGNILITPEDRAVLLDFGMAHLTEVEATTLTRSFAGSPSYAAPEQLSGGELGGRTDIYALGVTLYECLGGRLPFEGGTMEGLFRKIMVEEPEPLRKLNAEVGHAVEVVTFKAMEKRPRDRYATAEEFAADLEALLEAQPIRARPPGLATRLARGARRHPARAAALITLVAALLAFAGVLLYGGWQERQERRAAARAAVADALRLVEEYRGSRAEMREIERSYQWWSDRVADGYMSEEEEATLETFTDRREAMHRQRAAAALEVIDLLLQAEGLDPEVGGVDDARARLYLARMNDARLARDFLTADLYRERIEKLGSSVAVARELNRGATLELRTDPPGADLYLFRYVQLAKVLDGGERRLVPVPVGVDPASLPLGLWALRVVEGGRGLEAEDLILEIAGHPIRDCVLVGRAIGGIAVGDRLLAVGDADVKTLTDVETLPDEEVDCRFARAGPVRTRLAQLDLVTPMALAARGGVEARVHHMGEQKTVPLPPGLKVRATSTPRFLAPACRVTSNTVEPGAYLVVLRLDGYEDALLAFELVPEAGLRTTVLLNPRGATPDGFVYVPFDNRRRVWMQEREVTCAEYLEFLNDPGTLAEIDASEAAIRVPRHGRERWEREQGRYVLPDDWLPDWPAIGVSHDDAARYARWLSERDGRAYGLPTRQEWTRVASSDQARVYPFGNVWRPKWVNSCFARPQAAPEPVMRYPIDESPYGVYDLCGSAAEWLDDWFDESRGTRTYAGSHWGDGNPKSFAVWAHNGSPPATAAHTLGFRLVIRSKP